MIDRKDNDKLEALADRGHGGEDMEAEFTNLTPGGLSAKWVFKILRNAGHLNPHQLSSLPTVSTPS